MCPKQISFQQIPAPTCQMSSGEIEQQQKDLLEKNTIINQAFKRKKDLLLEINTR